VRITNKIKVQRIVLFILISLCFQANAQVLSTDTAYQRTYIIISNMLAGAEQLSFKRAVFFTENTYWGNSLSYSGFEKDIEQAVSLIRRWIKANPFRYYHESDSVSVVKSGGIYAFLKDTITIHYDDNVNEIRYPFTYDFEDFFGKDDWTKMFVTKLLASGSGNCHSLPYLFKILADELGVASVWLSFAPNHIYLRNRCKKIGWYNTELTSGQFPLDAWVMASGYVSTDAIRSGIYMDTLSTKQAVANCAVDLAKGYERKYKLYTDSFIVRCCDLALKYHPNNINAIIYKAETLKKMYFLYQKDNPSMAITVYADMEKLYVRALDLGYKEMPEKMYREWLSSMAQQKNKYDNKKVSEAIIIAK